MANFTDTYRHKGLRRQLIAALRERGIKDESILAAFDAVPRHFFLEKAFEEWAYADKPFPIGKEQTISQPYTVAYQTSLLEVQKDDKILEIGTGSGYQAAILASLGAKVYTIERQAFLYDNARKLLADLGFTNLHCYLRDGHEGLASAAPFDKIIVTAGATEVPDALREQLRIGGILVIPVGNDGHQKMMRICRKSQNEYEDMVLDNFRFVPFLKGINKA